MATATNLKSEPPRTAPDRPTVATVATGAERGANEDNTVANTKTEAQQNQTFQTEVWGISTLTGLLPLVAWDSHEGDYAAICKAAGFNPNDEEVAIGTLRADYAGLPKGTLIVSGQTTEGAPFAYGQTFKAARSAQAGAL